jgi:hypothetical protein
MLADIKECEFWIFFESDHTDWLRYLLVNGVAINYLDNFVGYCGHGVVCFFDIFLYVLVNRLLTKIKLLAVVIAVEFKCFVSLLAQ